MKNRALDEIKLIGEWVARETSRRRYSQEEVKTLSSALIYLKDYVKENDSCEDFRDDESLD